jgi:hypothetical protein
MTPKYADTKVMSMLTKDDTAFAKREGRIVYGHLKNFEAQ